MKTLMMIMILFLCTPFCFNSNDSNTDYSDVTVNYVYPEDGSTEIPINHKFIVDFDQVVSHNEVRDNVILTKDGGSIIYYSIYDYLKPPTKTAVIDPPELEPGTTYKLTINKGLKSVDGGMVKKKQVFTFITGSSGDYATPDEDYCTYSNEIIKIYFLEHLNPHHIKADDESIKLRTADSVPIDDIVVEYDFKNRCVIITPGTPLAGGDYEAVYYGTIEDLGGNVIGGTDRVIEFSL